MMRIIKDSEFDELCKASYQKGEATYYENDYEQSGEVPPQFGRAGHQFIKLRHGLDIQRYYGEFRQPLNLDREHTESIPLISKFYLSGSSRVLSPGFKGVEDDYEEISGHNYLYYLPDMREIEQWRSGQQIQVIMIYMTLDCIKSFSQGLEPFPKKLQQLLEDKEVQRFHQPLGRTNRAMQQILHQILSCPYQGLIRQMYLEGKALELVAIQLAHWSEDEKKYNTVTVLRPDDIERLHYFKGYFNTQLEQSPILIRLGTTGRIERSQAERRFPFSFWYYCLWVSSDTSYAARETTFGRAIALGGWGGSRGWIYQSQPLLRCLQTTIRYHSQSLSDSPAFLVLCKVRLRQKKVRFGQKVNASTTYTSILN
jgi:hypothetical protein